MNKGCMSQLRTLWNDKGSVEKVNPDSTHKRRWHCDVCGADYMANMHTMMRSFRDKGDACPSCTDLILVKGRNDLATKYPELASMMDPSVDPSEVLYNRTARFPFVCPKGHRFMAGIEEMLAGRECTVCRSGGYASECPEAGEWDGEANLADPSAPDSMDGLLAGSNKKAHWVCGTCGTRWVARICNRCVKHQGCPECAKTLISAHSRATRAKRDPLSAYPDAAKLWNSELNDETPDDISAGSGMKRWFTCEHGHDILAEVRSVVHKGLHCRLCDVSDPISADSDLMEYWIGGDNVPDPSTLSAGEYRRVIEWRCPVCRRTFESSAPAMRSRLRDRGTMCPVCGMEDLVPGVNDLATTRPDLADELADPSQGSEVTERSRRKLEWVCMSDPSHGTYTTTPAQRVNGVGCKTCTANARALARNAEWLESGRSKPVPDWIMEYTDDEGRRLIRENHLSAGSPKTITVTYPDCGHERSTTICNMGRSPECPICAYGLHMSAGQEELTDWVGSILPDGEVLSNAIGVLGGKRELDIYVPSHRLAIEYNGLYWHNEEHVGATSGCDKWRECAESEVRLLTVWDDDWQTRKDTVKTMIMAALGMPAGRGAAVRVRTPTRPVADMFMDRYSLDHAPRPSGDVMRIGAVDDGGEYLAIMEGHGEDGTLVIDSYADTDKTGMLFGMLLDGLTSRAGARRVIGFSDNCQDDGGMFADNGFVRIGEIAPGFFCSTGGLSRIPADMVTMDLFREDDGYVYEPGMDLDGLMTLNGMYRVYDSGRTKWARISGSAR